MGIGKNFLYSSVLTASNYLFPFILYPYVLRTLGVENIGVCDFVDSIINYFVLFSMLGISIVGVREIAQANVDKDRLNSVFTSLIVLNGFTTIIAVIGLVLAVYFIPTLETYKEMLFIGIIKLVGNFLLIEWFYKGIENFKYITIRTVVVKTAFLISVFVLVRNASDYKVYYFCYAMMYALNAVINCLYASKIVRFNINKLQFLPLIKPFVIMGVYLILTSMYTTFNSAYLGFVCSTTQVGYYTTASKMFTLLLAVYTAFTVVMLPRMSALLAQNKMEEFKALIVKSVDALLCVSIPIIVFSTIFAPELIAFIAGDGYEGAINPTRVVMPLVFIIGYEQILVIQTLMPLKKDKVILTNSLIGAIVGILMNVLMVKTLQSTGSSIAWLLSEIAVLISAQYYVGKYHEIKFPFKKLFVNVIAYVPCVALLIAHTTLTDMTQIGTLTVAIVILIVYVVGVQYIWLKNEVFMQVVKRGVAVINIKSGKV